MYKICYLYHYYKQFRMKKICRVLHNASKMSCYSHISNTANTAVMAKGHLRFIHS